ncbi:MAG: hypothetical protein ACI9CE_001785 [Flavobacterium sp.]
MQHLKRLSHLRYLTIVSFFGLFICSAHAENNTGSFDAGETERFESASKTVTPSYDFNLVNEVERLALLGVFIPPTLISAVSKVDPQNTAEVVHLKQWLEWLADDPDKLGRSLYLNEPLVAGALSNIEQAISLGSSIKTGGGILLTKHWQHAIEFQTTDSSEPNFVSLKINNPSAKFEISSRAFSGIHGGLDQKVDSLYFKLVEGELRVGDKVTIEYRNLILPTKVSDHFSLPVYFSLSEFDGFFQIREAQLTIRGGSLAQASLIVPSYIRAGINFEAKVYLKDKFGNLAEGRFPSFDILLNGVFFQRINAGIVNRHVIEGLNVNYGTESRIEIRSSGGGISASANPFTFVNTRKQIKWGDTRTHTADGIGDTSSAELDFVIPTTRDQFLNTSNWNAKSGLKSWVWQGDVKHGGRHQIISDWFQGGLSRQTNLVGAMLSRAAIVIGSAAFPIDDRFINNKQLRYIELLSNTSQFESYANRLLNKGYRLSFTASNQSDLIPLGPRVDAALTAVIVEDGEDWFSAFSKGRTYVTSGHRLILDVSVDSALPGERIRRNAEISEDVERVIEGRVKGTAGIHKIDLVKNGKVIHSQIFSAVPEEESPHLLKVTFYSDTVPYQSQRDLPRNGREWLGYFKSEAKIKGVDAPGFLDSARQGLSQSQPNRVDFITWTRGSHSGFLVDLVDINEDTVFEINLKEGHEDIDVKPLTRQASHIPSVRQMIPYFDLVEGPQRRKVAVNGYDDEITLAFVSPLTKKDASFRFVDKTEMKEGDYYYIRVQQIDDQMAWSSPVFVGGFDQP